MPNDYRPAAAFNLYEPPSPEYNPIRGQVVRISALASERPVLLIERANKHRIRAIVNNDDIRSDSVPAIGAMVECIQERGLWVYVRTLTIREGHSSINVLGAGWNIARNRAHLYSSVDNWFGGNLRHVALQTADSALHVGGSAVEISGAGSGVKVGSSILFDGGFGYADIGTLYQPAVAIAGTDLEVTSASAGSPSHTHIISLASIFKLAQQMQIDSILVDAPRIAAAALAAPSGLSIDDNAQTQQRIYGWRQYYPNLLWYNVYGRRRIITDPDDIDSALAGGDISEMADSLLATMISSNFLAVSEPIVAPYADNARGIGRTRVGRLSDVTTTNRKITQIEIVGFCVQAQVDRPRRLTPWSEPVYLYYVDYET